MTATKKFRLTWSKLQSTLRSMTKPEQVNKLLEEAIAAEASPQFVLRIQGRASKLRRQQEQRTLMRRMK